jgi:hypothetical protein
VCNNVLLELFRAEGRMAGSAEDADKDEVCRVHQVDREYLRVLLYRAKARFRVAMGGTRRAATGS